MPASVRSAIPLALWNWEGLHALDLPARDMPVDEFRWMLDIPLWAVDGAAFQVTPNQVLGDPTTFTEQYQRTRNADLSWPIHVLWHNDRWTILDGVHRLLKASHEERTVIASKVLSDEDYRDILDVR